MLNQVYNNKYTKVEDVMSRLSSSFKKVAWDKNHVTEWCADLIIDLVGNAPDWYHYKNVKIAVNKKIQKALQPCNVYRLLNVKAENMKRVDFYDDGTYIKLPDKYGGMFIYIDYYGLPVNEQGELLILKEFANACYYHSIIMEFEERYMSGEIELSRWNYFLELRGIHIDKGIASIKNVSDHDIMEMIHMQYNMLVNVVNYPMTF